MSVHVSRMRRAVGRFGIGGWRLKDGIGSGLDWLSTAEQETPIRSRLEICKRFESLPLSSDLNRAFSIRNSVVCDLRFVAQVGNDKIAKNLRLENCSLVILKGASGILIPDLRLAARHMAARGSGALGLGAGGWKERQRNGLCEWRRDAKGARPAIFRRKRAIL